MPKTFVDKIEDWRKWREDFLNFVDTSNKGMKEFLEEVLKHDDLVSENWIEDKEGKYTKKVTEDSVAIYRALKGLTDGEARGVVCGVKSENGFHAWKSLHNNFEPGLNSKKGRVLYEFTNMVLKPAKNTDDLRMLLVEMETKIKTVEDITGEVVSSAKVYPRGDWPFFDLN